LIPQQGRAAQVVLANGVLRLLSGRQCPAFSRNQIQIQSPFRDAITAAAGMPEGAMMAEGT